MKVCLAEVVWPREYLYTGTDTYSLQVQLFTTCLVVYTVHCSLYTRLLHPQHLDGILTGLTPYRVPLDPLIEYPEPWF